jgi:hypothetical protein
MKAKFLFQRRVDKEVISFLVSEANFYIHSRCRVLSAGVANSKYGDFLTILGFFLSLDLLVKAGRTGSPSRASCTAY